MPIQPCLMKARLTGVTGPLLHEGRLWRGPLRKDAVTDCEAGDADLVVVVATQSAAQYGETTSPGLCHAGTAASAGA